MINQKKDKSHIFTEYDSNDSSSDIHYQVSNRIKFKEGEVF